MPQLPLNADAGFDAKSFRGSCDKRDINANACFNGRNGNTGDREEYFDQDLYDKRYAVEHTKYLDGQLQVAAQGSIQLWRAGRGLTIWLSLS